MASLTMVTPPKADILYGFTNNGYKTSLSVWNALFEYRTIVTFQAELGIIFFSIPVIVTLNQYTYIYYKLVSLPLNWSLFEAGDVNIYLLQTML